MEKELNKYKLKVLKIFAVLGVLMLTIPTFFRLWEPLPGFESYYFINKFSFLPEGALRFLPILFGLLSLALFYILAKELGFRKEICIYSTILLAVSTPFMYLSNFFTYHIILMPILLLALYFYNKEQKIYFALSIVLFLSTLFFDVYALVSAILLLTYSLTKKKRVESSIILSFVLMLFMLLLLPQHILSVKQYFLQHVVFEFGSPVGLAASSIILSLFGLMASWKYKYGLVYVYLAAILLSVLSKFFFFMPIYLNLFAVLFSAYALSEIINTKWELDTLKAISIIAVVCTILFASVSYSFFVKDMQPSGDAVDSLIFLKAQPYGVVFSHPDKGFWIEYYAGKPVFSDTLTANLRTENLSAELYYSRNFKNSTRLLNESKIKYIWIDKEMKEGQVWTKPEQGLLFLFVDANLFKKIYSNDEIEAWQYLKAPE